MPKGSYRHFLKLFLRDETEPLIVEVREPDVKRFTDALEYFGNADGRRSFFCFESVDGRSFAINMGCFQAVHLLWEPSPSPSDRVRHEGPTVVSLRGRKEPIESGESSPEELYSFFLELEEGPENVPFTSFEDEDGERLIFSSSEIVFVTASTQTLDEGRRAVGSDLEDGI